MQTVKKNRATPAAAPKAEADTDAESDTEADNGKPASLHAAFVFYSKYSAACQQMLAWWAHGEVDKRVVKLVCADSPTWRDVIAERVPVVPAVWLLYDDGAIQRLTALHRVWPALRELGCLTAPRGLALGCPAREPPRDRDPPAPVTDARPSPLAPAAAAATERYAQRTMLSAGSSPSSSDGLPRDPSTGALILEDLAPVPKPRSGDDRDTVMGAEHRSTISKGVKKPSIMEAAMAMKTEYEQHLNSNAKAQVAGGAPGRAPETPAPDETDMGGFGTGFGDAGSGMQA